MGVSIQFESDRVEFWAIYSMERDKDVLEYYDQSSRIPLGYRANRVPESLNGIHQTSLCSAAHRQAGRSGGRQADLIAWRSISPLAISKPELDSGTVLQARHMPSNWG